jgi:uncharacterized SAM-dependent methyltransferase
MSLLAQIFLHPSQFPESVQRDLLNSFRTRQVNHKFHYDSPKQTQKWLALHEAYSPARKDPNCAAAYDRAFEAAARRIDAGQIHLIGLGCGGGQKDTRLLKLLLKTGKNVVYTPADVSLPMVLVARKEALSVISDSNCSALVCDLASARDLSESIAQLPIPFPGEASKPSGDRTTGAAHRLVTFFGMIPNFEPKTILPRLAGIIRPKDYLLFSANLAPGDDYAAGVQRILPQYNNELTRDWLLTFLNDLGIERQDGTLHFIVEADPAGSPLKRIVAYFHFRCACSIQIDKEKFEFEAGESIRLFFSYRYTPELVCSLLSKHGVNVLEQWLSASQEEGVFLCTRQEALN